MDSDGDKAKILHAIPGRIRIRLPRIKGDARRARQIETQVARVPGVRRAEANPLTGSLLLRYDLDRVAELLASAPVRALLPEVADAASLFEEFTEGVQEGEEGVEMARAIRTSFGHINARTKDLTGGFDLKVLVPVVLALLGVRALLMAEKAAVPVWYDFLWFSLSTFFMLNMGQHTAADGKSRRIAARTRSSGAAIAS